MAWFTKILALLHGMKLWQKVNGAILVTFFFITVAFTAIDMPYEKHRLSNSIAQTELLLRTLVERDADPLANEIFERRVQAIQLHLKQMLRLDGILEINVYDPTGILLVSDGPYRAKDNLPAKYLAGRLHDISIIQEDFHGNFAIRYFQSIDVIGEKIGFIEIYYNLANVERDQRVSFYIAGGSLLAILLIMTLFLNIILSRTIILPIASLSAAMDRVRAGELGHQLITASHDEIGDLTRAFNQMSIELKHTEVLKDHFLANISHELRTPLNGIIGIAESLLDGAGGQTTTVQAHNLKMIAQSGRRLASLVDDILDFSKIKHHTLKLQLTSVDPRSVTDVVLAILLPIAGRKPVQIINDVDADLPLVQADENRLQQILLNLVGNAIKFTAQGEIRVSAEILEPQRMLRIVVTDTGIGIPKYRQERIFEAFEQGDGSVAREYGGTGLGLSICRQLIQLHGGQITVDSEPGAGSRFAITVPLAPDQSDRKAAIQSAGRSRLVNLLRHDRHREDQAEAGPPAPVSVAQTMRQMAENSGKSASMGNGETILIVDDEPINLQVLHNQLHLHNYRTIEAQDGIQALKILQTERPDLILLDLMMPRMTGYDVIRKIRDIKALSTLPIIILTARDLVSDLTRGFSIGANDFVTKPFNKEELLARIQSQMKLKHAIDYLADANVLLEQRVRERTAELEKLAMIDALTGIANRRHFDARAAIELAQSRRDGRPLTLLALDIDHFKKINDSLGHAAGDVVLQHVAQVLSRTVRPADLVARIGGEEFAIIMPSLTSETAVMVAERIRTEIEKLIVPIGESRISVTASVGIATLATTDPAIAPVHLRADEALYRAKRAGRNRVVVG